MIQRCKISGVDFEVDAAELAFLQAISPVIGGQQYLIPAPQICPEERQRRRLAFRNLRNLYRRQCDLSQRPLISMYPAECAHTVFHNEEYFTDKWNALDYGVDYDSTRSFFEQLADLYRRVPTLHHYVIFSENCEYINGAANCRNCYLSFNMDYCEDCYYVTDAVRCVSCVDCLAIRHCELCYECVNCERCYGLFYSERSENCRDSYFLTDCRRCKNCIGCCNLQDKEFYVFNKKVSKAEFECIRETLHSRAAVEKLARQFAIHRKQFPSRYYFGHSNEDFSGDELQHVKNTYESYFSSELENCRYCNYVFNASNCYDYNIFGDHSQWMYQCLAAGLNCSNNSFCMGCWNGSSNNLYLIASSACSDCFGCCGLTQKKYCVLNKQYSKNDYEDLVKKIIGQMTLDGEWGEFFPPSMSPFAFHTTAAAEEFPLPNGELVRRGYNVQQTFAAVSTPAGSETLVPDSVTDVDASASKAIFVSPQGTSFRIIAKELEFHQKYSIAFSAFAPEERHQLRSMRRPSRRLVERNCENCKQALMSTRTVAEAAAVLCEACFRESVA